MYIQYLNVFVGISASLPCSVVIDANVLTFLNFFFLKCVIPMSCDAVVLLLFKMEFLLNNNNGK